MNDDQLIVQMIRDKVEKSWATPNAVDCIRFVFQELGELDSMMMRCGYQANEYNRNHIVDNEWAELKHELAQTYLMLLSLANILKIDLSVVLKDELERILNKHASMSSLRTGILATESGEVSEM